MEGLSKHVTTSSSIKEIFDTFMSESNTKLGNMFLPCHRHGLILLKYKELLQVYRKKMNDSGGKMNKDDEQIFHWKRSIHSK